MRNLVCKSLIALSGMYLVSCGNNSSTDSGAKKWGLLVDDETREFVAHGCQKKEQRLYCLVGESEDPGAFPRLTFHLPLPLENKEYTFQPAESETEAINCQPDHTGLIYRTSNESEPYFSCARGTEANIKISDSGDDFMEAGLSATMADKEGNKLTISFERIRFSIN